MTAPVPEPGYMDCPWPMDPACQTDEWDSFDIEVQTRALALASSTLRRLTGYRVGGCALTVRPCKADCSRGLLPAYPASAHGGSFFPHMNADGYWINSCGCLTECGCSALCEIELPAPVGEVYEVKVDGAIVAVSDYRIDGNRLVWTGVGDCPWPSCQDLALPDTEPNTFSVKYLNASPVDKLGSYAVGILAIEFAKACAGSNKCRLPSGVTSIVRQGVSFEIQSGLFLDGFTGIREVDVYIGLWNPDGLRRQTQVWSPDLRTPRVMR